MLPNLGHRTWTCHHPACCTTTEHWVCCPRLCGDEYRPVVAKRIPHVTTDGSCKSADTTVDHHVGRWDFFTSCKLFQDLRRHQRVPCTYVFGYLFVPWPESMPSACVHVLVSINTEVVGCRLEMWQGGAQTSAVDSQYCCRYVYVFMPLGICFTDHIGLSIHNTVAGIYIYRHLFH